MYSVYVIGIAVLVDWAVYYNMYIVPMPHSVILYKGSLY